MAKKKKKTLTKEQCALVTNKDVQKFIRRIADRYGEMHPSVGKDEFYSIGVETVIRFVGGFDPNKEKSFMKYICKFIVGEMRQHIRKEVLGIHQEMNDISYSKVVMIEEMKLGKVGDDEEELSADEKLAMLIADASDEQMRIWDRLEPLLDNLSDDERELILVRYGFYDNQGETIEEYIKKHDMQSCVFYRKAQAVLLKLQGFARNND